MSFGFGSYWLLRFFWGIAKPISVFMLLDGHLGRKRNHVLFQTILVADGSVDVSRGWENFQCFGMKFMFCLNPEPGDGDPWLHPSDS